ncbi:DUF4907 domain-containing protein [Chryseobacterium sp.]|uniref:DUF4907 domain-containing protein n=1 Tax=Chryseobacterium sp. TaxID=1871047 RepID=UPI0025BB16C0|nr:DUF4907 domain-containing protein [Chryseobacterium sp.]
MIKNYWKLFFFPVLFLISCGQKNNNLDIKITKQDSGYGYQIIKNRKIVINQPYIPAINGEIPFKSSEEAQKTAELVVSKIGKYSLPRVSVHELDSMKIEY